MNRFMRIIIFLMLFTIGFVGGFVVNDRSNNTQEQESVTVVIQAKSPVKTLSEFERSELYWLTMNIYHESRGEDSLGKLMVGLVTLKRLADGRWGNTIKEVVTCPYQFSWYNDGKSDIPKDKKSWEKSKQIAILAQKLYKEMGDYIDLTHYHNNKVKPKWSAAMERVMIVGNHVFYKEIN